MKGKFMGVIAGILASILLSSCSEEGSSVVGPDGIQRNLEISNINTSRFAPPFDTDNGFLVRWDYQNQLIPVKTNGSQRAVVAMDSIESELGFIIFDRTSIASTPDDQITHGIIVSEGTAMGPPGGNPANACGNVSSSPSSVSWSDYQINNAMSARLYVNLDSSGCTASQAVATHEFGHALGLFEHFEGFGIGPPIDGNFWNVLYNLYTNTIGSTDSEVSITQIK